MTDFVNELNSNILDTSTSRRQLLKGLGGFGLALTAQPFAIIPAWSSEKVPEKALTVYNTHTGESLKKCAFWTEGKLNPEAMAELTHLFRDHRTNEKFSMDPDLMHLIHNIWKKTETTEMIHLISGYRSPKTNAILRQKSGGVASKSQHLCGKAADIMIPGRSMKQVQQAAQSLKVGGVGRYANFVHVDTGRVRYW